jgi:virginiamycin B lyase
MYRQGRRRLAFVGAALGILTLAAAPAAHAIVTVGSITTPTPNSRPTATAVAPDGRVWFTEEAANKLGYIDANSGFIHEVSWTTQNVRPNALAIDSSTRIWFTEANADRIGMYDPSHNYLVEYAWGDSGLGFSGIEVTTDGRIWFTMFNRSEIGVLDLSRLTVTYYHWTYQSVGPVRIRKDAYGRLWFTEYTAHRIGVLDPYWNYVYDYYWSDYSGPWGIAVDANQYVWFTENQSGFFSRLDPHTGLTNDWTTIGGSSSAPRDIATTQNPSGQTVVVWAESGGPGNIGVLNAATGSKMGVSLSPSSEATGVAIDSQQNVWFTETGLSQLSGFALSTTSITRRTPKQAPGLAAVPPAEFHVVRVKHDDGTGKNEDQGKLRDRQAKIDKKEATHHDLNVTDVTQFEPKEHAKKYR